MLCVTTTATLRPELLIKTYDSFTRNVTGIDFKQCPLFLNIDLVPPERAGKVSAMVKIAKKFFGEVVTHVQDPPSFPAAVKWCWSCQNGEIVFNLEDDWLLSRQIDGKAILQMFRDQQLYQVVLRPSKSGFNTMSLCPSFIRGDVCRMISTKLNTRENPELQLRANCCSWLPDFPKRRVIIPESRREFILVDTGRTWLEGSSYKRPIKTEFTSWVPRSV